MNWAYVRWLDEQRKARSSKASTMKTYQIAPVGDSFFLRKGGVDVPLLGREGGTFAVAKDWYPNRALVGLPGVAILEMRHRGGGGVGIWLLNEKFHFITNDLKELPDEVRVAIMTALPLFPNIPWQQFPVDNTDIVPAGIFSAPSADRIPGIFYEGVKLFNDLSDDDIDRLSESWEENEYLLVQNALTADAIAFLTERITFADRNNVDDVRQFYRIHNDMACFRLIQDVHAASRLYYEKILSSKLMTTNAFAMKYIKGSDLHPHYDNLHTPISSTVCYHFGPEGVKNPLFFDKAKFFNPYTSRLTVKDREGIPPENIVRIDLAPGDIGIFKGRTHLHWREPVQGEIDYRAVLLHFSESHYRGVLQRGRPTTNVSADLVDLDSYTSFREDYSMYFEGNGKGWT